MTCAGKTVLVAGGTGGLGRAVTLALLEEGALVTVTYRSEREWIALKSAAGDHAARVEGQPVDVTDEGAVKALIDGIVLAHGRLDVLVNTVGAYAGGAPAWEMETGDMERMLSLNFRSGWVLARAAVLAMLPRGEGAIVNVASKAALDHEAGAAAYAASKAASLALMDALAADLKGSGVRVNSVLPSIFDTDANRKAMPGADFARWPKPGEIARVIVFLASDDANVIHGAALPVYGKN